MPVISSNKCNFQDVICLNAMQSNGIQRNAIIYLYVICPNAVQLNVIRPNSNQASAYKTNTDCDNSTNVI